MVVNYTDLALYDSDPVALFKRALDDVQMKFPEWVPREGNLEVVLLEAFATVVAETVYAANRAPAAIMVELLQLYGLTRDAGDFPLATLRFTLADNGQERSVPIMTRVLVTNADGESMLFGTNADFSLAPGVTTGTVPAVGDDYSDAFNGQALTVELLDAVSYVDKVELVGPVVDGRDPEDLQSYLDRGAALLSRLTTTLVRDDQFATAAMEDPLVSRAIALDLYDPGQVPPDNRPGHITVAVLGADGELLTVEQKAALEQRLEDQAVAILQIHVVDVSVNVVDVDVDVEPVSGWTATDVRTSVIRTLEDYLNPLTWSFGNVVYYNELISVVDHAPGVQRVINIAAPAGDVALAGLGPVADLGSAVVRVDGVAP